MIMLISREATEEIALGPPVRPARRRSPLVLLGVKPVASTTLMAAMGSHS